MEVDRAGYEVLSRDECLRLLSTVSIGRVAWHARALPLVVPVVFVVTEDGLLIAACDGAPLGNAIRRAVVAFEADEIDPADGSGWTVSVTGISEIAEPSQLKDLRNLSTCSWLRAMPDRWVRVPFQLVAGRRLPVPVPLKVAV